MGPSRRVLSIRISDEARSAIEAYCARHSITVTGLVEAVGRRIQGLQQDPDADLMLRAVADDTVRIARLVDRERRARRPGRDQD